MYLLVVYDGSVDAEDMTLDEFHDYILAYRFLEASEVGELTEDLEWHDGGRPSKGDRARLSWPHVFDRDRLEGSA